MRQTENKKNTKDSYVLGYHYGFVMIILLILVRKFIHSSIVGTSVPSLPFSPRNSYNGDTYIRDLLKKGNQNS